MNFEEEIEKHLLWRSMIESLFNDRSQQFASPSVVTDDHLCQLGKWIHSKKSEKYSSLGVFRDLQDVHKKFHTVAGEILSLYQSSETEAASNKLDVFYQLSDEVVACLENLKSRDIPL